MHNAKSCNRTPSSKEGCPSLDVCACMSKLFCVSNKTLPFTIHDLPTILNSNQLVEAVDMKYNLNIGLILLSVANGKLRKDHYMGIMNVQYGLNRSLQHTCTKYKQLILVILFCFDPSVRLFGQLILITQHYLRNHIILQ